MSGNCVVVVGGLEVMLDNPHTEEGMNTPENTTDRMAERNETMVVCLLFLQISIVFMSKISCDNNGCVTLSKDYHGSFFAVSLRSE